MTGQPETDHGLCSECGTGSARDEYGLCPACERAMAEEYHRKVTVPLTGAEVAALREALASGRIPRRKVKRLTEEMP